MEDGQAKVRMPRRKYAGINALAGERGIIAATAMDQRDALRKAIRKVKGSPATDAELSEFKMLVTEALTPHSTAILLDPEYGLEAARRRAKNTGVILSYEKTGYDPAHKGRLPALLSHWSVRRLVEVGANAVKVLLYYDPDDIEEINTAKQALIERVGAECQAYDVPFFLEVLAYSDEIGNEKAIEFARVKPLKVKKYMQEFSRPHYGVDILKVEIPVNMRFVGGTRANKDAQVVYSSQEAKELIRDAAQASRVPFIYLSAGVSNEVFLETLELVAEAGVPFSGVLCGRATWQDGVSVYIQEGPAALRQWLDVYGVRNIEALNQVLRKGAQPWWDFYGGKDAIEVIERIPLEGFDVEAFSQEGLKKEENEYKA